MNKKINKLITAGLSVMMCGTLAFGFAGCKNVDAGDRTVVTAAISELDADTLGAFTELVETYNNGQGITDNVFIDARYMNGPYAQYMTDCKPGRSGKYGIVMGRTDDFKNYARYDIFENLDKYLTDSVKEELMWEDIPAKVLDAWKFNVTPNQSLGGKYEAGEGQPQLALPVGNTPQVLFYNTAIMQTAEVNVISQSEAELKTNTTYSKVKPHGYAEYLEEPFSGAKKSTNFRGEAVYKVFNDRIPLNWEETRNFARELKIKANLNYGVASWWWFHYGFSVGGDCIGWDEQENQYKFTLANDAPNWLVTEDGVKIDGGEKTYKKGQVLIYEDAKRINNSADLKTKFESKLYKMPSQKDAIREFICLTNEADKTIDVDADGRIYSGYGISYPEESVGTYFNVNKLAMYVASYDNVISQSKSNTGRNFDIAPLMQYREFEGGSVYYNSADKSFANEELKIIGKEYDGEIYSGDIKKTENGTDCVGEVAGAYRAKAMMIPKNYDESKKEAAFKFIKFAASPEGQKIISKTNYYTPNQTSVGMSDEVCNSKEGQDKVIKNTWAVAFQNQGSDLGDYDYFCSSVWTNRWANDFNSLLRKGGQTFNEFLIGNESNANKDLSNQIFRLYRR